VLHRTQQVSYDTMARWLGWHARTGVGQSIDSASPYLRSAFEGEAVLTLGGAIHEWRAGVIDGVISVGPLECMPNKLAETQFFHVAEHEGLPSLTIPFNGDPLDPEVLDNFAFAVRSGFRVRRTRQARMTAAGRADAAQALRAPDVQPVPLSSTMARDSG
jgi:hypothetical protein